MEKERIYRKARSWPELPQTEVALPSPPSAPSAPNPTTLITMIVSLVGLVVSATLLITLSSGNNLFFVGFLAISGFAAIGSFITFLAQRRTTRRQTAILLERYRARLKTTEDQVRALRQIEAQERTNHDPPFWGAHESAAGETQAVLIPLGRRAPGNHDPDFWARKPGDLDFLAFRVGLGLLPASYHIQGDTNAPIALDGPFDALSEQARKLVLQYRTVMAPVLLTFAKQNAIALLDGQLDLRTARALARAIIAQICYHHSPADVRVIILAPASQQRNWDWAKQLPHTRIADLWRSGKDRLLRPPAVALGAAEIDEHLIWLARETNRREVAIGEATGRERPLPLPYLLIVVDQPDPVLSNSPSGILSAMGDTNQGQESGTGGGSRILQRRKLREGQSPLRMPDLALALARGQELGCSVLALCADRAQAPATTGAIIDIRQEADQQSREVLTRGYVHELHPDAPHTIACLALDEAPVTVLQSFAAQMQVLRPARTRPPELPAQVDLRQLFDPALDLAKYDPWAIWKELPRPDSLVKVRTDAKASPSLRIPVGARIGDEIQMLDLVRDGPHGLLIGQTGSGKSELLQTIIMALAVKYAPEEVTFLLIDYKAGLALEPYARLPHTVGFLSNVASPGQISRFITMLRAEAAWRAALLAEATNRPEARSTIVLPRLLIVIDEFAEMAKRSESVLDEIFSITKLGRELGMHLLLSAQRSEGVISAKVRDYVQYRFCLRCASPEDSREVLGRTDAASLPAAIPGRGFLLHGDNQLELFQAARVTSPPSALV